MPQAREEMKDEMGAFVIGRGMAVAGRSTLPFRICLTALTG